tara:strand:+ start:406 stop:591 length:186 start_codon:yes stop_codon:yes gene_type:complete
MRCNKFIRNINKLPDDVIKHLIEFAIVDKKKSFDPNEINIKQFVFIIIYTVALDEIFQKIT